MDQEPTKPSFCSCIHRKQTTLLLEIKRALQQLPVLHFYTTVIHPVLYYAWHYSITHALSYQLESIQKRAVHITFSDTRGMSHHIISKPDSCLHHLLPRSHDTSVISRLRSSTSLPRPISQTKT